MIPIALRITNFRSFKKQQEFRFPQEPGLFFMQGLNEEEPRLGANGAGKSTVWEALCWCIYGKTSRGLKAGDVNNWEAGKGTRVEFDFIAPSGEECRLIRAWGPNSWTLASWDLTDEEDLTKSADNTFLAWLGLGFQSFLNSVMMSQSQPMFLDQDRNVQAAIFSDVMGLDQWLEFSANASKKASLQDATSRGLERKLANLEGELKALGKTDLRKSLEEWEVSRQQRLQAIAFDMEMTIENSYGKEELAKAIDDEQNARANYHQKRADPELIRRLNQAQADLQDNQRFQAAERRSYEEAVKRLQIAEQDEACSACGLRMGKKDHQNHLLALSRDVAKKERSLIQDKDVRTLQFLVTNAQEALEEAQDQELQARTELDVAVQATDKAKRDLKAENELLDSLEEKAECIEKEVNPFAAMEERGRKEVQRLQDEIEGLTNSLEESQRKYSICSYWVRGFKELRLKLISEALTELEIEVNSCVAALGLVGWELNFQVDRETKSGSLQRGFSVLVRSPHNQLAVPWEAWSGGEAQRLRLAANMGLADLIRSRTGTSFNLELWDEPTQGLSPQGQQDLLESLAQRAINEQRCIWIVDHHSHAFGNFAGGATIIKTPSGSRIRQS